MKHDQVFSFVGDRKVTGQRFACPVSNHRLDDGETVGLQEQTLDRGIR